jgi:ribosomal protein S18 acetylase RimI-like enzyme
MPLSASVRDRSWVLRGLSAGAAILCNMAIRLATVADSPELVLLWLDAGLRIEASDVSGELAAVLERDSLVLVHVTDEGRIAGAVLGTFDGRRGWVNRLAVRPGMRGQGIASELIADLEQRLIAVGCPQVNLLIDTDNADVTRFYARLGYQPYDVIFMAKRLTGAARRDLSPELFDEPYVFVTVSGVARPEVAMFAAILEDEGLTLVLTKADADRAGLQYTYTAARITLRVNSTLDEVGLTAKVSRVLADAGISCNVIAGAAHDHLFVDWPSGHHALDLLRQLLSCPHADAARCWGCLRRC